MCQLYVLGHASMLSHLCDLGCEDNHDAQITIYLPLSKNVNGQERCQMKLSVCTHENVGEAWITSQETWLKSSTYLF